MRAIDSADATTATTGTVTLLFGGANSNNSPSGGRYAIIAYGTTLTQANVEVSFDAGANWISAFAPTVASNKSYGVFELPIGVSARANVSGTVVVIKVIRVPGE